MSFRKIAIVSIIALIALFLLLVFSCQKIVRQQAEIEGLRKIKAGTVIPPVEIKKKVASAPRRFESPQFQKGITYVTWDRAAYGKNFSDASLARLPALGCEWVAIMTSWYQKDYNSTEIAPAAKTPSDESLIHAIDEAHRLGLKILLKPHLDLLKTGYWRGEIDFPDESGWEEWFKSYRDFIVHYAKIAQEKGVEMFCVGVELTGPSVWKPELWDKYVIQEVRKVYTGPITYAANWNEEYLNITFWDKLDYAGLDAYFPLSDKERPTLEDLREGWNKYMPDIEAWQKKINKPVLLTEVGYKSSTGAAKTPWEHQLGREVDLHLQSDCYTAMFEAFWDKPWFYGMYWWYCGTNERMGGSEDRGFNVQNKPAQEIIKQWYHKPINKR